MLYCVKRSVNFGYFMPVWLRAGFRQKCIVVPSTQAQCPRIHIHPVSRSEPVCHNSIYPINSSAAERARGSGGTEAYLLTGVKIYVLAVQAPGCAAPGLPLYILILIQIARKIFRIFNKAILAIRLYSSQAYKKVGIYAEWILVHSRNQALQVNINIWIEPIRHSRIQENGSYSFSQSGYKSKIANVLFRHSRKVVETM